MWFSEPQQEDLRGFIRRSKLSSSLAAHKPFETFASELNVPSLPQRFFRSPTEPDFMSEKSFSCAQMAQLLAETELWRNCERKSKVMDWLRNSLKKQRQYCREGRLSLFFRSSLILFVIIRVWAALVKTSVSKSECDLLTSCVFQCHLDQV